MQLSVGLGNQCLLGALVIQTLQLIECFDSIMVIVKLALHHYLVGVQCLQMIKIRDSYKQLVA